MINVDKQIEYWRGSAESDIETALLLIQSSKTVEGLFFCHLAIEKILKAYYVKHTKELAPKTHKLQYLAEQSSIELSNEQKDFFGVLMQFQIEGRYPEFFPPKPSKKDAMDLFTQTQNTLQWLIQKLQES
jgi:HEPN domain-containing protein